MLAPPPVDVSGDARTVVCFPFVGDALGGSHVSALLLIQALAAHPRFEPELIVHGEGVVTQELRRRGLDYTLVPAPELTSPAQTPLARIGRIVARAPRLASHLRARRCRIVHTNDMRMHLLWAAPARLAGARFVWHQRSRYAPSRLTRCTQFLAHRVVCISSFGAGTMPSEVRPRLRVIDNPIEIPGTLDRAQARDAVVREFGLPQQCVVVAFVGNLTAQKRPETFIAAAARLAATFPRPVAFVLLGADLEGRQPSLEEQARLHGIADRVHFLGFRHPVERWIAGCDLLIAPGFADAFGRTLVEAMAVGTPVIASASGGHSEIISDGATGVLVSVDDAAAFARAADALLRSPSTARQMADRAAQEVVPRYSISRHATAVTQLYAELLA